MALRRGKKLGAGGNQDAPGRHGAGSPLTRNTTQRRYRRPPSTRLHVVSVFRHPTPGSLGYINPFVLEVTAPVCAKV